jgi:hypothetical protein
MVAFLIPAKQVPTNDVEFIAIQEIQLFQNPMPCVFLFLIPSS